MMWSLMRRGGVRITSLSTGSTPRLQRDARYSELFRIGGEKSDVSVSHLCAGGPSMMMLIHRICIALSGFGSCIMVDSAISVNAAMLLQQEWHVQASTNLLYAARSAHVLS